MSLMSMRDRLIKARSCRRSWMASRVYRPCLSAFLLPRGAPDPGAPPCMRQRFLPLTAGDLQGLPDRVLAPQRRLESIGAVLRGWLPASIFSNAPVCRRHPLRLVNYCHGGLMGIGNSSQRFLSLLRRSLACGLGHVAHDRLTAFADRYVLDGDLLLAPGAVALQRLQLGRKCPGEFVESTLGTVLLI